jgi:ubiquinol-cytochrome c reductase cytochrome c subunit
VIEDFDADVTAEFGFEPAVSATGASGSANSAASRPARARRPLRRRLASVLVFAVAFISVASGYAAFASSSGAASTTTSAQDIADGQQLYDVSCIACHGANLQGVSGRGVPLLGAGGAAVYFQVSTGRMPSAGQGADNDRKKAKFNETQTQQLAAFVESVGGGPSVPAGSLRDSDIADGGALFRLNCASCHGTTFKGAPLSGGKQAPSLNDSTDAQIYAAMLSGPESMPVFSDNQLTPTEKREVIGYIQTIKASKDPGGSGIDRIGPVSEALVIWIGGVGFLIVIIMWIGAKTQ